MSHLFTPGVLQQIRNRVVPVDPPSGYDLTGAEATADGWDWSVSGGEVHLIDYDVGVGGAVVVIPDTIDEDPVKTFEPGHQYPSGIAAFRSKSGIDSISLTPNATYPENSFYLCSAHTLIIRSGFTALSKRMCKRMENLASVEFPVSGLTHIYLRCFEWCASLVNIVLPESISFLGDKPFNGCDVLTDVYFKGDEPYIHRDLYSLVPAGLISHIREDKTWSVTPPANWHDRETAYWTP